MLYCFNKGCLSASCDICVTSETWLIGAVLSGLVFGLAVAVPTAFILSRYSSRVCLWIVGCILTACTTILVGIMVITSPEFLSLFLVYGTFLGPMVIGVVSAPFIYAVLLEPKQLDQES